MKTTLLFAAVSCLLLLAATGKAQQYPPQQHEQSPKMEIGRQAGMRAHFRAQREGANSMVQFYILNAPDIREGWGITDEQYQQVQDAQMNMGARLQNIPEFQEQVAMYDRNDPFMYNADEATLAKYRDITERLQMKLALSNAEAIDNILTAEQKQLVNEFTISTMSGSPVFSPSMFEALGLTDDQRQEIERIKKEFEPQFEKNIEDFINSQQIGNKKWREELKKQGIDPKELTGEQMAAIGKKMMEEDPEFARISKEDHANREAFSTQFKTKMFDVLTDEQWSRFEKLVDNHPEYYKAHLNKWRRGEKTDAKQEEAEKPTTDKQATEKEVWTPGPNSWQPGDPIPESYRHERRSRGNFPRPRAEN
jgi:Ni/Co efflux regulator RcnB